jgi:hypothetical protein
MNHEGGMRELAATQHGLVSYEQARFLGLRSDDIRRLLASTRWQGAAPRVLRAAGAPLTDGQRLLAAVLDVGRDAVASHESAAWWWEVPGFGLHLAQVTTFLTTHRVSTVAEVHRVREFSEEWVTVLNGIPIVRPELMILQLCATLHPGRAERALDNAWKNHLLTGETIDQFLDQLGRRGRNGVALMRSLREARDGAYVPPDSNLERRATEVLAPLGLDLVRQVNSGGERWSGRVDLRDRTIPLIIEVQSEKYHSALTDRRADDARREALENDGFVVVEITDVQVWTAPDVARQRVATARQGLLGRTG